MGLTQWRYPAMRRFVWLPEMWNCCFGLLFWILEYGKSPNKTTIWGICCFDFPTTKHANLRQSCLESSIRSGLQEEAQDSINLCKFGAMRYSPPTPKKNHSPISSSSAGGELLALFVWLPIVKFRQDFHQRYLHIVGMEKAENSSWQLDWIRLLHLNKSYGKKLFVPKNISSKFPIPPPEVVGFYKKDARKMHCADGWTRDGASNVLFLCSARRRFVLRFGVFGAVFLAWKCL